VKYCDFSVCEVRPFCCVLLCERYSGEQTTPVMQLRYGFELMKANATISVDLNPEDIGTAVFLELLFFTCVPIFTPSPVGGRGNVFGRFLSLFLCQQHYKKTAGPICMKFSGKLWSDHGTT